VIFTKVIDCENASMSFKRDKIAFDDWVAEIKWGFDDFKRNSADACF